jgi:hypothetical protein
MAKREAAQDAAVHAKGRTPDRYQRSRALGTKTLYLDKEQSKRLGRSRQVFFDTFTET